MDHIHETPKLVVVGSASYDRVRLHPSLDHVPDMKDDAEYGYSAAGGGGVNVAIVAREVAEALDMPIDIDLFTKLGPDLVKDKQGHTVFENDVRPLVLGHLDGINVKDVAMHQPCIVPDSHVTCWKGGRFISRDPRLNKLTQKFQGVVRPYDPGTAKKMDRSVRDADLTLVQASYSFNARLATAASVKNNVPVATDYDITKLTGLSVRDPHALHLANDERGLAEIIASQTDYLLAPGEALATGMGEAAESSGDLLNHITRHGGFRGDFAAVSNGGAPVEAYYKGQNLQISPGDLVNPKIDALAAGDTRDGAFAEFTIKGDNPVKALEKANAISAFSIGYVGREWVKDLKKFMQGNDLFKADFAPEQPPMSARPANPAVS